MRWMGRESAPKAARRFDNEHNQTQDMNELAKNGLLPAQRILGNVDHNDTGHHLAERLAAPAMHHDAVNQRCHSDGDPSDPLPRRRPESHAVVEPYRESKYPIVDDRGADAPADCVVL